MRPQVGQVFNNKYRLLRLIGDGGMGTVYEARHEVLGTSVALKFLHAELGRRAGLVQRFLQEARVSAQITSRHVVRVTDVDQSPTGAFIVMEYIEGKTLQTLYEELYRAGQQLPQADAIEYAMQMLEGVEAAHQSGIVHRDLKPDNVMITLDSKGRPLIKLLDFGIAKLKASPEFERGLTRPGVIMGTPEYMAPEQAMSADTVDARADIFALGVIIFEMLGGRRPVGGEDPHQIAGAYVSNQIARLTDLAPDVPVPLAEAVHRAIAALPSDRWASVADFRDAIEPYAAPPRPPTALPPAAGASNPGASSSGFPAERPSQLGSQPLRRASLPSSPKQDAKSSPPVGGFDLKSDSVEHRYGVDPITNPAEPPSMSEPPARPPTPLGGLAGGAEAARPLASDPPKPMGDRDSAESWRNPKRAGIPDTRSVSPLSATPPNAASNARASAVGLPGTAPLGPLGGVDLGFVPAAASKRPSRAGLEGAVAMGSPEANPAAKPVTGAEGRPSAVVVPAPPSTNVRLPSVASLPKVAGRPGAGGAPRSALSLPAILLLAGAVSAAVVGGVYIAHDRAKADDHEDPPPPTAMSVPNDPPPVETAAPVVPPTATARPQLPPGPRPPFQPIKPPKPGSGPSPQPSNTGPEPLFPLPVILPSGLPIDLPFFPPSRRDEPNPDKPEKPAPKPRQPPSPRGQREMLWRDHARDRAFHHEGRSPNTFSREIARGWQDR